MIFNPDLYKEAQEVIFSSRTNKTSHPTTTFNTVPVARNHVKNILVCILMKS